MDEEMVFRCCDCEFYGEDTICDECMSIHRHGRHIHPVSDDDEYDMSSYEYARYAQTEP